MGRPKGGGGEQARLAILDAAVELFAQLGYRGTSMTAIAAAAGLSNTGVSHHFPDKSVLLAEVLDRRDTEDHWALGDSGVGWEGLDYWARLLSRNQTRPGDVRLFTTLAGEAADDADHPGHAWLMQHYERSFALLAGSLRAGIDAGTVAAEMPVDSVARLTIAISDGLQIQWLDQPEEVDMPRDFAVFVDSLKARWSREPSGERT